MHKGSLRLSLIARQRASQRFEDIFGDAPKNTSISGRLCLKAVLTRERSSCDTPVDDRDRVYCGIFNQDWGAVDGGVCGGHARDLRPGSLDFISDVAECRPQRGHYLA